MTKLAVIIAKRPNGSLVSVPCESLDPLLKAAKAARVTGKLDGNPVAEGVVLATWKHGVVFKFRHVAESNVPPVAEVTL